MTQLESIYFDLVRVVAALIVLVGHVTLLMPGALPVPDRGHAAVVAFFVLSGYVIAFVVDTKERTARDYFISRIARVYSVAFPALILTLACDFIGHQSAGHAIYRRFPSDWPLVRIGAALSFTSELWFVSIEPFSNGPYWSLCYEVWYYCIFAAAHYLGSRRRVVCVALLCLLVGPKILSMFPIWLLGVALYRYRQDVGPWLGGALVLGAFVGMPVFTESPVPHIIANFMYSCLGASTYHLMEYAQDFPSDYILGLLLSLSFIGVRGLAGRIEAPFWIATAIRWIAGSTFSLYLFHRPLVVMLVALCNSKHGFGSAITITFATIVIAVALSYVTERRKGIWRGIASVLIPRAALAPNCSKKLRVDPG